MLALTAPTDSRNLLHASQPAITRRSMPASLSAAAVQQFVVDGLHVVPPAELTLDVSFHRAVAVRVVFR